MIKNDGNNEQIYGRNDMVMLNPNNKIYGSLGIADKYVLKTEEGKSLTLSNPKLGKFGDVLTEFNMYGRSEQTSTTGAQLLPLTNETYTGNNVTLTKNADGSYTPSGTPINKYEPVIRFNDFKLKPGIYSVSGSTAGLALQLIIEKDGVTNYISGVVTVDGTETSITPIIQCTETFELLQKPIPFMINIGEQTLPIEPYTGGIPSPSPEYPQEIKSVGDNGSVVVNVTGANVLEGTKLGVKSTVNGITYTTYENGILITGTATKDFFIVLHNDIIHPLTHGDYYLTTSGLNSSVSLNFYYVGKFVDDRQNIKVTLGKDVEYSLRLQILKGATLNTTVQVSLTKSKITSYEPYYEEQTATLPYILNAIPVSSGGNVTIDGQQYIADYVDVEREKLVRMCYLYKFDMDDYVGTLPDETMQDARFVFTLRNASKEQFTRIGLSNIGYKHYQDIDNSVYPYGVCITSINETRIRVKGVTNKSELAEYLASNNVFLLYTLQTHIEEELTTEQAQALKELVTYYPVTIIENNYNTWMKATYKSIESV